MKNKFSIFNYKPFSYLKQLIKRFEEDKLPFSNIDKEEDKFTLAKTFIIPRYNEGKEDLPHYLDGWLQEDSLKHIALLGDYGTGKNCTKITIGRIIADCWLIMDLN